VVRVLNVKDNLVTMQMHDRIEQWDLGTGRSKLVREIHNQQVTKQVTVYTDQSAVIWKDHEYGYNYFQVKGQSIYDAQVVGSNYYIQKVQHSPSETRLTRATKATSGMAYQQMQELFNNLSRGSGTIVISAAAGNAYAYESEKWNNGVFTYCLINGLKNRKADKNKDGEVTIDELSAYVATAVYDLTDGNQRPNERQENQFNNFRL